MKEVEVREHAAYSKRLCPFIKRPSDDCYCIKLTSQDVEKAVFYCGGHFELCEIYKKK